MPKKQINRLYVYMPNTPIVASEHNEEHNLFVSSINDIYNQFEFLNNKLYFPASQVFFETYSSLNLDSFLQVAHNPNGTLKSDALGYPPSQTPTANAIPVSNSNGKLAMGWLPASTTPTANTIPIANSEGKLDAGWIPPINIDRITLSYYSRLTVGSTLPTSGSENDLFYRTTDNKLFIYKDAEWSEINWQPFAKASPEWNANRLRIQNGQLQISPDGANWYNCIPAIGANVIELMTVDNTNYTYLYWIPPGQTVIVKSVNHLPIVYAKDVQPILNGRVLISPSPEASGWIGIRPNNTSISNGMGQHLYAANTTITAERGQTLSVVPFMNQNASTPPYWVNIWLQIRSNNAFAGNSLGQTFSGFNVNVYTLTGTASSLSYWLGTCFRASDNTQQTIQVAILTRLA